MKIDFYGKSEWTKVKIFISKESFNLFWRTLEKFSEAKWEKKQVKWLLIRFTYIFKLYFIRSKFSGNIQLSVKVPIGDTSSLQYSGSKEYYDEMVRI